MIMIIIIKNYIVITNTKFKRNRIRYNKNTEHNKQQKAEGSTFCCLYKPTTDTVSDQRLNCFIYKIII